MLSVQEAGMILRKLAEAIHEQNWFTVVLEILIVVIGIYIGLQADAWNQSRLEDQRAQQALEDLKVDFVAIHAVGNDIATYYKNIIDDLQILIRNLKSEEVNPADDAAIKRAIANGDNFADPPPPSGTYRDLASSGDLALIRDTELRLRLIEYDESLTIIIESDSALNNRLGHFTNAFQRHSTLGDSWNVPDTPNLSFIDVTLLGIDQVDYQAMHADTEFRVAAQEHLKMQISRYANIRVNQSKITQIQKLIDASL
jgi:hypothetical protein